MLDEISQAVLAREEVVKYLRGGHGENGAQARERIYTYLEELRTTQRHAIYRALQHPLYPILRKIERKHEHLHHVIAAVRSHRVVYASNHRSHTDYLVEPLVLDDNGIRPPLIAAGINLFGGPLGLLHRHVTGAIPIRRNTKDPAYLITLKAYISEILKSHESDRLVSKPTMVEAARTAVQPFGIRLPATFVPPLFVLDFLESFVRLRQKSAADLLALPLATERLDSTIISLPRLASNDAMRILDTRLGDDASLSSVKDHLVSRAQGIPLFLEEMARSLIEDGTLLQQSGRFRLAGKSRSFVLPETIRGILKKKSVGAFVDRH